MTTLVVDASVSVKWFLASAAGESDVPKALQVLRGVAEHQVRLVQPPHWRAEVAAVIARLSPASAATDVARLGAIACDIRSDGSVLMHAAQLAVDLDHHLFDTLYHAVALETPGAVLVTADDRYARKAEPLGALVRLADLALA